MQLFNNEKNISRLLENMNAKKEQLSQNSKNTDGHASEADDDNSDDEKDNNNEDEESISEQSPFPPPPPSVTRVARGVGVGCRRRRRGGPP